MSLNVNTALYRANGVDLNNVQSVANQILNSSQQKQEVQVQSIDYSKFNRKSLGIDLYSSRTNVDLQKQIATNQTNLYFQAVDVAKLNSQAALNLYSAQAVQKNVELTQSVQAVELNAPPKIEQQQNTIELFNISDKNSNSSNANGFNPFEADEENKKEENKDSGLFNFIL